MPTPAARGRGGHFLYPNFARHGVKLYSQSGCDPRKQSAGRKDTTMKREDVKKQIDQQKTPHTFV